MAETRRRQQLPPPADRKNGNVDDQQSSESPSRPSAPEIPQRSDTGFLALLLKVVLLLGSVGVVFVLAFRPDFFSDIVRNFGSFEKISREPAQSANGEKQYVSDLRIYTKEELAECTGEDNTKPILLAYLGKVYDVTKGRRHYGPGGSYSFFSGKDATRSFLTGDFKNDLTDNLDGIDDSLFGQVESWADTYSKSSEYKEVGVLCGEFYQCANEKNPGQPTRKLDHVYKMIAKAKSDEAKEQEIYQEFPQCNSEWSQDNGGRVWCSARSGGIERDWTGYPRLLLTQKPGGTRSTRCACVHPDKLKDPRLELYPNCSPSAESCKTQQ